MAQLGLLFTKYRDKIPSWLWLPIILLGIALVICIPIGFIYVISHFEGVASIIFLIAGWFVFGSFAKSAKRSSFVLAGAVCFFALMGMAIDQPGNRLYNYPLNLSCPEGSSYSRSVITRHPLPERTDFVQNFQCYDAKGRAVHTIPIWMLLLTRFCEYIALAYLLLGIRTLIYRIRKPAGGDYETPAP